jgi:hypothetical protein
MEKSKLNLSTEAIKSVLETKMNPTDMNISLRSFKSLKYGLVLIEVGSSDQVNLLRFTVRDKCGEELEVNVPRL